MDPCHRRKQYILSFGKLSKFYSVHISTAQSWNAQKKSHSLSSLLKSTVKITSTILIIWGSKRSIRTSSSITRARQTFLRTSGSSSPASANRFCAMETNILFTYIICIPNFIKGVQGGINHFSCLHLILTNTILRQVKLYDWHVHTAEWGSEPDFPNPSSTL